MFLSDKILAAPQAAVESKKPKKRKELHVFMDEKTSTLRLEPIGTAELALKVEIYQTLGLLVRGGARDLVLSVVEICIRHDWQPFESWLVQSTLDPTLKHQHVKLWKEVDDA